MLDFLSEAEGMWVTGVIILSAFLIVYTIMK